MPEQIIEESDNIHDSGEHLVRIQKTYSVANDDEAAEIIHEGNLNRFTHAPKSGWTLAEIGKRVRQLKQMLDDAAAKGQNTDDIRQALQAVRDMARQCVPARDVIEAPAPPMTQEEINQKVREAIVYGYQEEKRREFGDYFLSRHPGRHEAIKEAAEGTAKTVQFVDD